MMKNNFNLPLTVLETGIYDNKHQHVATTTQSQDKAMSLAVNSHDKLVESLKAMVENYGGMFVDESQKEYAFDCAQLLLDELEGKS